MAESRAARHPPQQSPATARPLPDIPGGAAPSWPRREPRSIPAP
jgi:hypothetical protein